LPTQVLIPSIVWQNLWTAFIAAELVEIAEQQSTIQFFFTEWCSAVAVRLQIGFLAFAPK